MKKILISLITVSAVFSVCQLTTSCENNNFAGTDVGDGMVALNFTAVVGKPQAPETKAVIGVEGTTFPSGTRYVGMFINKAIAAGGQVFEGSQKMKVIVQLSGASMDYRSHDGVKELTPRTFSGSKIRIAAYYPWRTDADDIQGVPFDFSGNMNTTDQQDLLYCGIPEYNVPSDPSTRGILTFKHAYTRIKINVRKKEDKATVDLLSSVSIDNLSGEWIKKKGKIDPATGTVKTGAEAGQISSYGFSKTLQTGSDHTFEFLVPAFMDKNIANESIVFILMINGKKIIFPLKKEQLNHENTGGEDRYGFEQGYTNTYNLVYDNSELRLLLLNWTSIINNGNLGETGVGGDGGQLINYPNVSNYGVNSHWNTYPTDGSIRTHLYETYLSTVALGNNGIYVSGDRAIEAPRLDPRVWIAYPFDKNVYMDEHPYAQIYVTTRNITRDPVTWEGEDGRLVAKEICRKYRGGGFTNWRLPRASEMRMVAAAFSYQADSYEAIFGRVQTNLFWTATERDATNAWGVYFQIRDVPPLRSAILSYRDKKTARAYIRCVREKDTVSGVTESYIR